MPQTKPPWFHWHGNTLTLLLRIQYRASRDARTQVYNAGEYDGRFKLRIIAGRLDLKTALMQHQTLFRLQSNIVLETTGKCPKRFLLIPLVS